MNEKSSLPCQPREVLRRSANTMRASLYLSVPWHRYALSRRGALPDWPTLLLRQFFQGEVGWARAEVWR